MTARVRQARSHDWPEFWPLLVGMGARDGEESSRERFVRLTSNPFWLIVVASDEGRLIGYAAAQDYGDHLRVARRAESRDFMTSTSVPTGEAPGWGVS